MKKVTIIIAAIVMIAGFSSKMMAQTTTDAGAKIVTALALTETADLHFGTMTIPTGAVNVILTTATGRSATPPTNITLLDQAPTATNAAYTVAGSAGATYAIELPANSTISITSGANTMAVDDFVSKTASAGTNGLTGTLDGAGADSFVIGATLKLGDAQAAGVYLGTFDVTVAYN